MATTTTSSFRLDPALKKSGQIIAKKMGTNLSNVLNMYLAQFVRDQRLNIVVRDEEGFTTEASAEILAAIHEAKTNTSGRVFSDMDELIHHLRNSRAHHQSPLA